MTNKGHAHNLNKEMNINQGEYARAQACAK